MDLRARRGGLVRVAVAGGLSRSRFKGVLGGIGVGVAGIPDKAVKVDWAMLEGRR